MKTFNNLSLVIDFIDYSKGFIFEYKILIMTFILYRLIHILSKKVDIVDYSYDGVDFCLNEVKIKCFNLNYTSNDGSKKYKNLYYRFSVDVDYFKGNKPALRNHILIVNRNDIELLDKVRFLFWMCKELVLRKICGCRDKKLPNFLVKVYILPNTIFI
jgi:hypothetical protein